MDSVNRYADLIKLIIKGSFYDSRGTIVPYRMGNTEVRLETNYPSTEFGIYINEKFSGTVYSDPVGNVVFERHLDRGEVEITLLNHVNARKMSSWLTVRDYATFLISYAAALETIDSYIQTVHDDMSLKTVTLQGVEGAFGNQVELYNDLGQALDDYRKTIHELRLGYRNQGGKFGGLEVAASLLTQVPPFGYSRRMWGPNWVLDQSMLANHRFLDRSCDLSKVTNNITGVDVVRAEADCASGTPAGQISYNFAAQTLTWTPTGYPSGPNVDIMEGELFLPGPPSSTPAFILGLAGPFVLAPWADMLYLNCDERGTIAVQLVTGFPFPNVAQVVGDINAAMLADPRYGIPYASSYNSKVLLSSPLAPGSRILVEHGPNNCANLIFGVDPLDLVFNPFPISWIEIFEIVNVTGLTGNATIEYDYVDITADKNIRWKSPTGGFGPWITIPPVDGDYDIPDGGGNIIRLRLVYDDLPIVIGPPIITVNFTIGYRRCKDNVKQNMGIWVGVNKLLLPLANAADNVDLLDDFSYMIPEGPDYWSLNPYAIVSSASISNSRNVTGNLEEMGPASAMRWKIDIPAVPGNLDIYSNVLQYPAVYPNPHGSNSPQRSTGLFYDYEGLEAKFSGWILGLGVPITFASLGFSFDNGATWVMSPLFNIKIDPGLQEFEKYTYMEFSTVIPAGLMDNGVLTKIVIQRRTNDALSICLDGFAVEVKYISSRYLLNATVPRTRHRQYFGELDWCWSQDVLTTLEKKYMGLPHKIPDKNAPIGGVTITGLSADTNVGSGSFDYEYNSLGDTHRMRWTPNLLLPSVWVTITGSGDYYLYALDGSYMTVRIDYAVLPILLNTPPAATISRVISIDDDTINQGHCRKISPAHSSIDIFDITEYDVDMNPINLFGSITESDFSLCTLVNLEIKSADPFKYSFLYPLELPVVRENLSFNVMTHRAMLSNHCDLDQNETILYEDGNPVPNDCWTFISDEEIHITVGFNPAAVYTIDYNLIYKITTPVLDLLTSYQDYAWMVDYLLWDRMESEEGHYPITVPVYFNPNNGRAVLDNRSDMDMSVARLYYQDNQETKEIAKRYWRFLDQKTIEVDLSQFVMNAQYFLTHDEVRVYEKSRLDVTFEHRSGTTEPNCLAATWHVVEKNENVYVHGGDEFHQLRLSISKIRTLDDFRIRSLVLKGLHVYGTSPSVPGLTNVWR